MGIKNAKKESLLRLFFVLFSTPPSPHDIQSYDALSVSTRFTQVKTGRGAGRANADEPYEPTA